MSPEEIRNDCRVSSQATLIDLTNRLDHNAPAVDCQARPAVRMPAAHGIRLRDFGVCWQVVRARVMHISVLREEQEVYGHRS